MDKELAQAIIDCVDGIKTSVLVRDVHARIAKEQKRSAPMPPFKFDPKLWVIFEKLTNVSRINVFYEAEFLPDFAPIRSLLLLKPRFFKLHPHAVIIVREDKDIEEMNFAMVKESCHILLRDHIFKTNPKLRKAWPGNLEELPSIVTALSRYPNLLEAPEAPDLTVQERAMWKLERKATRLALRVLCPDWVREELINYYQTMTESDEVRERYMQKLVKRKLLIPRRYIEGIINEDFDLSARP